MDSEISESLQSQSSAFTISEFPSKILIASALIFINIFQNISQARKVKQLIEGVSGSVQVNEEAKEELFCYLTQFNKGSTVLYPIMVREYCKEQQSGEYKIGLLINGDVRWQQIIGKIKQHVRVEPQVSLTFFCSKRIVAEGSIKDLHSRYKGEDGIMYIQYIKMQSYG